MTSAISELKDSYNKWVVFWIIRLGTSLLTAFSVSDCGVGGRVSIHWRVQSTFHFKIACNKTIKTQMYRTSKCMKREVALWRLDSLPRQWTVSPLSTVQHHYQSTYQSPYRHERNSSYDDVGTSYDDILTGVDIASGDDTATSVDVNIVSRWDCRGNLPGPIFHHIHGITPRWISRKDSRPFQEWTGNFFTFVGKIIPHFFLCASVWENPPCQGKWSWRIW